MIEGQRGREISSTHVSELDAVGLDYWWVAVRCAHVDAVLQRLDPLRLLDLGCGPGRLTEHFIKVHEPERALGLDGTRQAVERARARGLPVVWADLRAPLELDFAPTAVTCLDVLEHLEDPIATLSHLHEASAQAACLVVSVPAMPSLYSRWDELAGHHRRYTRSLLARELEEAGWRVRRVRYIFAYGAVPAWIQRRVLRRVREIEFPPVSGPLNALLVAAGEIERRLGAPMPFGTSLFAVAERG